MSIMKRFLLVLTIVLGITNSVDAQLPNGTIAPDFTLTDRDGNVHNLYTYLNEGKVVFLKFFACHCPSCWAYHNTGKLESLYQTYGPDGTNQIMVLMLEYDQYNPDAFYGLGGYTQGDWITGNSIPMVDVEGADRSVFDDYNLNYYPMIMKVCNDKTVELMSTGYSVATLFQEADDCAGNLGVALNQSEQTIIHDAYNQKLILEGFAEISNLSIYNLMGQQVLNNQGSMNNSIELIGLKEGVYIVQIEHALGTISKKIIVQ